MSARALFALLCALLLWSCKSTPELPDEPVNAVIGWDDRIRGDIDAAFELFIEHHPGVHDPLAPGFRAELERAREAGLAHARDESDLLDYKRALASFSGVLGDGHALVHPLDDGDSARASWPGFVTAWRGETLAVHSSEVEDVPVGSKIVSCDGVQIEQFLQANLPYVYARVEERGQWWSRAPRLFVHDATSLHARPTQCDIEDSSDATKTIQLTWSDAPADIDARLSASTDGDRLPIGLSQPADGVYWIALPDFSPDAAQRDAYEVLFEQLGQQKTELASARAVVLDLRHNNGGSSVWSLRIARALWGREVVDARREALGADVEIWWRASAGNARYLDGELAEALGGTGQDEARDFVISVASGMDAARGRGEPYFKERREAGSERAQEPAQVTFEAPVYVITPGRCASACLDAVDVFSMFDNTTRLGAPTSADSTYMEVRGVELPSGKGRAVIPTKLWRGRPRGAGEFIAPHIEINTLDWSTKSFLNMVLAATAQCAR